jgi:hypothetical protein
MQLTITNNLERVAAKLGVLEKQATFATAVALTRTARDIQVAIRDEMQQVFDRPTRFTLNSLFLRPATKVRLEARVWVKDSERPSHYIKPEIEGGARPQKRFEELLRQRGILAPDERIVPGQGAKLDAFGNMGRGQIVQILSQLRAFNLAGSSQNATNSKRSRAKRAKVSYFYAVKGKVMDFGQNKGRVQHLRSGIYARTEDGRIVPVMVFVKSTNYKKRLRFFEVGRRVFDRNFERNFEVEYRKALATAKWGRA